MTDGTPLSAPRLGTRDDFTAELAALKVSSPHSYHRLGKLIERPASTVHGWCRGKHLPYARETAAFSQLLAELGVADAGPWIIALNRLRAHGDRASAARNPYPGLEPFTEADHDVFVARDHLVTTLFDAIDARRQTNTPTPIVVVGPSGSGKTSLLRAGFVARTRTERRRNLAATYFAPSEQLAEELADTRLHQPTSVVIVDQFEMLLSGEPDRLHAVIDCFDALLAADAGVVVALRSDHFDAAAQTPMLLGALQRDPVIVAPLRADDIVRCILEPAEAVGLQVDPDLLSVLIREFADTDSSSPTALPLLSHVLFQLAQTSVDDRLTLEQYRELGGLRHALAQSAEATYESLDGDDQHAAARRLFMSLIELGGRSTPVRRTLDLDDLERVDRGTPSTGRAEIERVIAPFVDAHLLTVDRSRLTISHDALLTAWPRLQHWIDDERASLVVARRVATAAATWWETGDDGALLRGSLLDDALPTEPASNRLTAAEHSFVERSLQARTTEERARRDLLSRQSAMQSELIAADEPVISAHLAVLAFRTSPTVEARSALLDAGRRLPGARLHGTGGYVVAVADRHRGRAYANSGDGRSLVTARRHDDTPTMRSPSGSSRWTRGDAPEAGIAETTALAVSGDGTRLAVGNARGEVAVLELDGTDHGAEHGNKHGVEPVRLDLGAPIRHLALDRTGASIAIASGTDVVLATVARQSGGLEPVATISRDREVFATSFRPDHDELAIASADSSIERWTTGASPRRVGVLEHDDHTPASAVCHSPDGRLLAAGWYSGEVRAWDLTGPASPIDIETRRFGSWINSVSFPPDGCRLAAASSDGTVGFWDTERWAVEPSSLRHPSVVTSVDFVDDDEAITICEDGIMRTWLLEPPGAERPDTSIWALRVSRDDRGAEIIGASQRGASLWRDGRPTPRLTSWRSATDLGQPLSGAMDRIGHGDETLTAIGTRNGKVLVVRDWGGADNQPPIVLDIGDDELIESVAIAPDHSVIVACSRSGAVGIWSCDAEATSTETTPTALVHVEPPALGVAIRGSLIGVVTEAGTAHLLHRGRAGTWERASSWTTGAGFAMSIAVHPTADVVAVGNADRSLSLWRHRGDGTDPTLLARRDDALGHVMALTFDATGRRLIGGSTDGNVLVWDTADPADPQLWCRLPSGERGVYAVAIDDADARIFGAGPGERLLSWSIDEAAVLDHLEAHVGDPLTPSEWTRFVPPGIDGWGEHTLRTRP